MQYDLFAFDLFAAPRDRHDFLQWVNRAFMDNDSGWDASRTTSPLRAWHRDMAHTFPGMRDPHALDDDDSTTQRVASYRFTQSIVQASFRRAAMEPALHRALRGAQVHGVGLFEAGGHEGAVWMMSPRGRFEIVHRQEDVDRGFGQLRASKPAIRTSITASSSFRSVRPASSCTMAG